MTNENQDKNPIENLTDEEDSTVDLNISGEDNSNAIGDENSASEEQGQVLPPQGDPFGGDTRIDLEHKLSELNSKYLYAVAELDNARKRHIKERSELMKYAGENMARDFLEVMDDLERAATQSTETDTSGIIEGINLISNRMRTLFERFGIKGEECLGEPFDPKKHEALTMAPSSIEDSGKIIKQISRSYFFKDKLLRPAQVIVGSGELAGGESVTIDEEA